MKNYLGTATYWIAASFAQDYAEYWFCILVFRVSFEKVGCEVDGVC